MRLVIGRHHVEVAEPSVYDLTLILSAAKLTFVVILFQCA
jgi:hypothetical protein